MKKKRFYFIDLENVGKSGLKGIENLTTRDTIVVFHNRLVYEEISPAILDMFKGCRATIRKLYIRNICKNAMDLELVLELGFLMAEYGAQAQYFVVSKDRGFDIVNDYIQNKGLYTVVRRIPSVDDSGEEEKRISEMEAQIRTLLPEYSSRIIQTVQFAIDQTNSLDELHKFLQKHLKYNINDIYPKIKQLAM